MVEFDVLKNEKGFYAKPNLGYKFALIERKHLGEVKEGEKWLGEVEKEFREKRTMNLTTTMINHRSRRK